MHPRAKKLAGCTNTYGALEQLGIQNEEDEEDEENEDGEAYEDEVGEEDGNIEVLQDTATEFNAVDMDDFDDDD